VDLLLGDATLIRERLGWAPMHTFDSLVKDMMDSEG
jgi:GDP-D-mannose dehydratase